MISVVWNQYKSWYIFVDIRADEQATKKEGIKGKLLERMEVGPDARDGLDSFSSRILVHIVAVPPRGNI